ncbi:MAG: LptA/OstA family protein [Alphaproteobacteria bacterium]|nr:LptA/OstA family protein [Alphaproteobacteria bacterium]
MRGIRFSKNGRRLALAAVLTALMAGHAACAEEAAAPLEVSADKSLEWYQDKNLYVARGNAKAVQGAFTIKADLLTAHKRVAAGKKDAAAKNGGSTGDIDRMTAEGHVEILRPGARLIGDQAVNDLDKRVIVVTGKDLRYETNRYTVSAQESLEYWEDTKTAVARGKAKAVHADRTIRGDVLTAELQTQKDGKDHLNKLTAAGNVVVVTKSDVIQGDKGVYDAVKDRAIVTGHVRITRPDGTELTGDTGEANFTTNRSRLLNEGDGRVHAILPAKKASKKKPAKAQGEAR